MKDRKPTANGKGKSAPGSRKRAPFRKVSTKATSPRAPVSGNHLDVSARIARRAYELYEQRGRQSGHDFEDWLEAERQILGR